jgi:uncharacterized protein with von Willebrand factor type A (vWA) domain
MATPKTITNDKLYDAINSTRLELKGDIRDLRSQFDNLEAGRLTRAEGNINDLRVELQKAINTFNTSIDTVRTSGSVFNGKIAVVGALATILLSGLSAAIFYRLIVQ